MIVELYPYEYRQLVCAYQEDRDIIHSRFYPQPDSSKFGIELNHSQYLVTLKVKDLISYHLLIKNYIRSPFRENGGMKKYPSLLFRDKYQ